MMAPDKVGDAFSQLVTCWILAPALSAENLIYNFDAPVEGRNNLMSGNKFSRSFLIMSRWQSDRFHWHPMRPEQ